MSPRQEDYGQENNPALVPGALTAFRHFQISLKTGEIAPMNYDVKRASMGYPQGRSSEAYPPLARAWMVGMPPPSDYYEAGCFKSYPYYTRDGYEVEQHEAPVQNCTCGFYASYDPATDFYPSRRWGRSYAIASGRGHVRDWAVVRAVVEVSGRVVMGRVGVRAQRMKIKALALDWSKMVRATDDLGTWATWLLDVSDSGTRYRVDPAYDADADNHHDTTAKASSIAERYGAGFFDTVEEMHAYYPMEDVSALGVDITPVPEPEQQVNIFIEGKKVAMAHDQWALLNERAATASQYVRELRDALKTAFDAVDIFPQPKQGMPKYEVPPETTPFGKALAAKKKKPAPPGAGLDRRKKKL